MKRTFLFLLTIFPCILFAQTAQQIKQIDLMVAVTNKLTVTIQKDSSFQNLSYFGIKMKTIITLVSGDGEVKKYVDDVTTTTDKTDSTTENMHATNIFYYNHDRLIKVEEAMDQDNKIMKADWYYENDKPLYNTFKTGASKDYAEDRANTLLLLSKNILENAQKTILTKKFS